MRTLFFTPGMEKVFQHKNGCAGGAAVLLSA
jgi:hypothetical protein